MVQPESCSRWMRRSQPLLALRDRGPLRASSRSSNPGEASRARAIEQALAHAARKCAHQVRGAACERPTGSSAWRARFDGVRRGQIILRRRSDFPRRSVRRTRSVWCPTMPMRRFTSSSESRCFAGVKSDFAARGLRQLRRNFQQSRFSRSVVAHERDAFPCGNLQRNAAQRHAHSVALFDFAELDSQSIRPCRGFRGRHSGKMQAVWTRATAQPWTRSRSNCSARPRSRAYSSSEIVPAWRRNSMRSSVSFRESRFEFTSCVNVVDGGDGAGATGAAAAALACLRCALCLAAFGSRRRGRSRALTVSGTGLRSSKPTPTAKIAARPPSRIHFSSSEARGSRFDGGLRAGRRGHLPVGGAPPEAAELSDGGGAVPETVTSNPVPGFHGFFRENIKSLLGARGIESGAGQSAWSEESPAGRAVAS